MIPNSKIGCCKWIVWYRNRPLLEKLLDHAACETQKQQWETLSFVEQIDYKQ